MIEQRKKLFIELQPTEAAIFKGATDIFSAHIAAGNLNKNNSAELMRSAVSQALMMAEFVEEVVISENEMDPEGESS